MPLTLVNKTKSKWKTVTMYLLRWWANTHTHLPQNSSSTTNSINTIYNNTEKRQQRNKSSNNNKKQTNKQNQKKTERKNTKEHQIHCTPQTHLQFITQRNRHFPVCSVSHSYSTLIEFKNVCAKKYILCCFILFRFSYPFHFTSNLE